MAIRPLLRVGRAGVFAAVCVALAAAGHTIASHALVAPWALAAGFAGVAAPAVMLAGHERSLPTILGSLLGGQFMLHVLFSAARTGPSPAAHAGHGHLITTAVGHSGMGMTLAHYAAAIMAAWWLRRGERAVWTLARQVAALAARPARALLHAARTPPAIEPLHLPVPAMAPLWPVRELLRHTVLRRGPPVRSRALPLG
jgi:hypothetical protein